MKKDFLINDILTLPETALEYRLSHHLAELFPDKAIIEGDIHQFDVEAYAAAQLCTLKRATIMHNQCSTQWAGTGIDMMHWQYEAEPPIQSYESTPSHGTIDRFKKAWLEVEWQSNAFDLLLLYFYDGQYHNQHFWLLGESEELLRRFLAEVSRWNTEVRSEILVFEHGHWHKDEQLFHSIKGTTFENLILQGSLKEQIRNDIAHFFSARQLYEECGVPWKRGILFVGPPGNGKTHAVKALANSLQQPCLYVKSFHAPHGTDEISIQQVFSRARSTAPCLLVLEDLDSLVTPQNRSFFLNELDGFAANVGIVTLATTNHPERLDPAILDRPSRFDRKYPFNLPEQAERQAYIAMWNATLKPRLQLTQEGVDRISEATQEFSFAYLKELFLSSMMNWMAEPDAKTMDEVMAGQVGMLREQMVSAMSAPEEVHISPEQQVFPGLARLHMRPGMHFRR